MTFEEVARTAAKQAERAVSITLQQMKARHVHDEDDVTGFLVGSLATLFDKHQIGDVTLSAAILRHRRGTAAEERRYGADILIHVSMDTPTQEYSKGVLIQAKKKELTDYWSPSSHDELVEQCNRILRVTAAAFVFSYTEGGIRCGAAARVAGAKVVTNPTYLCGWTSYRFFLELFWCPIGDPRITSANVDELPVPFVLQIGLSGNLTFEPGASTR